NNTRVIHIGPWKSPAVEKTVGRLLSCPPGSVPAAVDGLAEHAPDIVDSLRGAGAVICVGERAAEVPGLFDAVRQLSDDTGARIAWIPRRAGERGALYAGAAPNLLPGGRRVTDSASRAQLERAWRLPEGCSLPATEGRDTDAILAAAAAGELSGLVIGGVDPADLADPGLAEEALRRADFVLSLELRPSAATEQADVVLPVAPSVEKSGSYLNWEGRHRPFDVTVEGTGALPDCRVLDTLAIEMDFDLFTQTPAAAAGDLARLGFVSRSTTSATSATTKDTEQRAKPGPGEALLATWRQLLDNGSMQDGEPHLAGTAREAVARISEGTAQGLRVELPGRIGVGTDRGWISIDAEAADMPDDVVWLPTNSGPSAVRRLLAAGHGSVVRLSSAARPVTTRENEDGTR
ncbi:MAG: molybdopterin-dependent oxidoreductase, partial [Sciscionella sp.]